MSRDLVARLRFHYRATSGMWESDFNIPRSVMRSAADLIEQQATEIERLRATMPLLDGITLSGRTAEETMRLIRLGQAVERQERMTLTSYRAGWNRCLDRIHEDAQYLEDIGR